MSDDEDYDYNELEYEAHEEYYNSDEVHEEAYERGDYKEHQERYESLRDEWESEHGNWDSHTRRIHLENMRDVNDAELRGRERARDERAEFGEDDEGHDYRIEHVRNQGQLLNNSIAHEEGRYEYETRGMRDVNPGLHRELERENNERYATTHQSDEDSEESSGEDVEESEEKEEDNDDDDDDDDEEDSDMDIETDSDDDY